MSLKLDLTCFSIGEIICVIDEVIYVIGEMICDI